MPTNKTPIPPNQFGIFAAYSIEDLNLDQFLNLFDSLCATDLPACEARLKEELAKPPSEPGYAYCAYRACSFCGNVFGPAAPDKTACPGCQMARSFLESINKGATPPPTEAKPEPVDLFAEANKLVSQDRQSCYGHPIEDFTRVAKMMSGLGFRMQDPRKGLRDVEAKDFPLLMILVKLSREVNRHKDDNLVDMVGYVKTLQMVLEKMDASSSPEPGKVS